MCHLRVSTLPICMWREERGDERRMGWTDSQTEEEWSLFMLSSILPLLFLLLSFLCQRTLKGLLILPPGFPPASTPLRLPLSLFSVCIPCSTSWSEHLWGNTERSSNYTCAYVKLYHFYCKFATSLQTLHIETHEGWTQPSDVIFFVAMPTLVVTRELAGDFFLPSSYERLLLWRKLFTVYLNELQRNTNHRNPWGLQAATAGNVSNFLLHFLALYSTLIDSGDFSRLLFLLLIHKAAYSPTWELGSTTWATWWKIRSHAQAQFARTEQKSYNLLWDSNKLSQGRISTCFCPELFWRRCLVL